MKVGRSKRGSNVAHPFGRDGCVTDKRFKCPEVEIRGTDFEGDQ